MEQQTFEHIARSLRPRLMRLCRSFFDRQEMVCDAEDAVQETLLRLWQMRDRLADYHRPDALATVIAKNVCINMLKRCGMNHEPLAKTVNAIEPQSADGTAIARETERIICNAMEKLPATWRRMLAMRGEGMSMAEIAAACGVTPDSAKTMVCAARRRMMELLNIGRDKK